jgi:sugar lactone lactonase YvrE
MSGSVDDVGTKASFFHPQGLAFVPIIHSLFVADSKNSTIRKLDLGSLTVSTLAGTALQVGSVDGVFTMSRFARPTGIAFAPPSTLYVVDPQNNNIRSIDGTGNTSTVAGPGGSSAGQSGSIDGPCAGARFNGPYGIAVDGSGNLYVTDSGNGTIRKITPGGGCTVSTLAGSPGLFGNVDASGATARFNLPAGIATDGTNVYVGDVNVIRQVEIATGAVNTIAGDLQNMGAADGIGSAAHLGLVEGLALDGNGNLFMSDSPNGIIRKMNLATDEVQTLAGSVGVYGATDGVGPAAAFAYPTGLVLDTAGNLFVSDLLNDTIRELSP